MGYMGCLLSLSLSPISHVAMVNKVSDNALSPSQSAFDKRWSSAESCGTLSADRALRMLQ